MKGFELETRLVYLDDNNQRQTLCGIAGESLTNDEILEGRLTTCQTYDKIDLIIRELLLSANRILRKEPGKVYENMRGLASHNLRHLADLMENDPDFVVRTATENGRRFIQFDIPNKEPK